MKTPQIRAKINTINAKISLLITQRRQLEILLDAIAQRPAPKRAKPKKPSKKSSKKPTAKKP